MSTALKNGPRRSPRSWHRGLARSRWDELSWLGGFLVPVAVLLAWLITVSLRGAIALVIVVLIAGVHQTNRRAGILALFAFWCVAPEVRRALGDLLGFAGNDPLSVAPFVATVILSALELRRRRLTPRVRRVLLLAAAGFLVGLPLGILHPRSGLYALLAYLAGLAAAVLGAQEPSELTAGTLRRVLLVGAPLLALYAILAQRVLSLPSWEQAWLQNVSFSSIGADTAGHVRAFSTLNAPGTLAPLLGIALLAYITVRVPRGRARSLAVVGALLIAVALELTFVRSSWLALPVGALAHVLATRGRSARLVLGVGATIVLLTVALAPVSSTARDVVTRASTFGTLSSDVSATARTSTLSQSLPSAIRAPLGHGLGTAGQPSQLNTAQADLAIPDDGYLALMYQVGPIGFLLVAAALLIMLKAAWSAARGPEEINESGALLFAVLVFMLVVLSSGDAFYGLGGLTLWFVGGHALTLAPSAPRRQPTFRP